jgi:hypothetical protein
MSKQGHSVYVSICKYPITKESVSVYVSICMSLIEEGSVSVYESICKRLIPEGSESVYDDEYNYLLFYDVSRLLPVWLEFWLGKLTDS